MYTQPDFVGEIWAAISAPARPMTPASDRRSNSFVKPLDPLGNFSENGTWWYTILATDTSSSFSITSSMLWPRPARSSFFMVEYFDTPCKHGESVSTCLKLFSESSPLPAPELVQNNSARNWRLFTVSPVLPGGFVLIGEYNKYVHISPQRFTSHRLRDQQPWDSDVFVASEIIDEDKNTLSLTITGAPSENVTVSIVVPAALSHGTDTQRAENGTVYLVSIILNDNGVGGLQCVADSISPCRQHL
eukprot:m.45001 g.45001  ORF g.45001 m.45001 type:complete len:246 (+) comp10171_c0_seq1:1379-2116(+)